MLKYLPLVVTVVGSLAAALLTPDFMAHHVALFAYLSVAAQVLHAALPSIFK